MNFANFEKKVEVSEEQHAQDFPVALRALDEHELALVGGGTGAVIWA